VGPGNHVLDGVKSPHGKWQFGVLFSQMKSIQILLGVSAAVYASRTSIQSIVNNGMHCQKDII